MNLKDKNILFLGSSVTYGAASGGISFVETTAERCGFSFVKEAVSGTTLADINEQSYISRLKMIDTNIKFDLFVCQLSTNDRHKGVPLKEIENAIVFICEYVKKIFGCPIVFYTSPRFDSSDYGELVERLLDLKEKYNFSVLDLWNDKKMQDIDPVLYKEYMKDPVHPTYKGYEEWWTPKFINFLSNI